MHDIEQIGCTFTHMKSVHGDSPLTEMFPRFHQNYRHMDKFVFLRHPEPEIIILGCPQPLVKETDLLEADSGD